MMKLSCIFLSLVLLLVFLAASAECRCESMTKTQLSDLEKPYNNTKHQALKYKLAAIFSILTASFLGVSLPILGKKLPSLHPDNPIFFLIKSFAAGVILSTAFVHILPDAFSSLASPDLSENPWHNFPFAGFIAMLAAIGTMMVDTFATSYFERSHFGKAADEPPPAAGKGDEEKDMHEGHVHVHTHATHGHAHGSAHDFKSSELTRHRIISQVLELGVVVHSVIIGVSLGASDNPRTIKPLVAALTFHQLFEGIGLGGCISQAKFKSRKIAAMVAFFCLTTPVGIGVGMGMSSMYQEGKPSALVVEGSLNSASAGILTYMALVDLIAADYMNPIMLHNLKLQMGANLSLLLGSASMSLLATWA
ncbi:zinc transporter 8-like [Syzygium oleosum]|uniref:zinc transporter 8-like n=1 Tax=Syzygium oleosum TaxID=219896 RepID=UPI0011D2313F|nr:zinc transporter 8-like [Syzygium oleosum]